MAWQIQNKCRQLTGAIAITVFLALPVCLSAQRHGDTTTIYNLPIQLDSFTVKSGFDVKSFIRRVQTDTTFYKAFKSMDLVPYHAANDIEIYDKHSAVIASLHSKTEQVINNHCRTTEVLQQKTTGDFYDRHGDYNYYTAGLYAYLFFTTAPVCNDNDIVKNAAEKPPKGQMEKSKKELEHLIFNPGSKVGGVPLMGNKASIFDESEYEKYDYKIIQELVDSVPCYRFTITPKPGYSNKVVFSELITWFRESDYAIVARDYSLAYSTLIYDFEVHMRVRTATIGHKLYPTYIDYDGDWHVLTKKRERAKFTMQITY